VFTIVTAENLAAKYGISRADCDKCSFLSFPPHSLRSIAFHTLAGQPEAGLFLVYDPVDALLTQTRHKAAVEANAFKDEIVAVPVPTKKDPNAALSHDEVCLNTIMIV
jgi:acetyl-CoA acetyltransferase